MSDVLILEFSGVTEDDYQAVNKLLDANAPEGEDGMPTPLESHTAALGDGGLVVVEVWESQAAQAVFMERLRPALAEVGVPDPSRAEWLRLIGRHQS